MKFFKRIGALLLSLGLGFGSSFSFNIAAQEMVFAQSGSEPAVSENIFGHEYINSYTWTEIPSSNLVNIEGTLYRVELIDGELIIETYDSSYNLLSQKSLSMELPVWGGYHFDGKNNWLVFGKNNGDQSERNEVVRIVKYSKDFSNRLGSASLYGSNITIPFSSCSVGFADSPDNSMLYIHSGRQMYMAEDYFLHQSNFSLALDKEAMRITDQVTELEAMAYGYTSHSFNQFIVVNDDGEVVTLDHGDGYERALILHHALNEANSRTPYEYDPDKFGPQIVESGGSFTIYIYDWPSLAIKEIPGNTGDNVTGLSAGDFVWTGSAYLAAYNYNFSDLTDYGSRKVALSVIDSEFESTKEVFVSTKPGTNPYIVLNADGSGTMLWNGLDTTVSSSGYKHASQNETLYYVTFDASGKTGNIKSVENAPLSGVHPILRNGKIVWYVTDQSMPVFYELNVSNGTIDTTDLNPEKEEIPQTPSGGGYSEWESTTFADVPSTNPYFQAVRFVAYNEIMTGYEDGLFHPNDSLTRGMVATILWRMFGSPELSGYGFADVPESSYYKAASGFVQALGLMTGNAHANGVNTFDGEDTVSRQDLCLIFYRLANQPESAASRYNDLGYDHYAWDAANWALEKGMIDPINNSFAGAQNGTRIVTANLIYQYFVN